MINFIICDDNEFFLMEICKIVDDFCIKKKMSYKIYPFKNYDFDFFEIEDGKVLSFEAVGGCNGNLKGIGRLIRGRDVQEVIEDLNGVTCGPKPTSCPDQIAKALEAYCKENG